MIFQLCESVLLLFERASAQSCCLRFCWEMKQERMCNIWELWEETSTCFFCPQQRNRGLSQLPVRITDWGSGVNKEGGWLPVQNPRTGHGLGCPWARRSLPSSQVSVWCKIISRSFPVMTLVFNSDTNSRVEIFLTHQGSTLQVSSDGPQKLHFEQTPW